MNEPWVSGVEQSNLFYTAALGSFFFDFSTTFYNTNLISKQK